MWYHEGYLCWLRRLAEWEGNPRGTESRDCFSSCSSCRTNGRGGDVAGAMPGSQDALTWPLQLAVGEQPHVFSVQSKDAASCKTTASATQLRWERWKEPMHASSGKDTWAKGHGAWLTSRCWTYFLITGILKGRIPPCKGVPNSGRAVCSPWLVNTTTEGSCLVKELKEQLVGSQLKLCLVRELLASRAGKHFQDGVKRWKEWDFRIFSP